MKYLALIKVFDRELASSWHSGSAISIKSKVGCETKEEGNAFINDTITKEYSNGDYQCTGLVLAYDEKDAKAVAEMFKYM